MLRCVRVSLYHNLTPFLGAAPRRCFTTDSEKDSDQEPEQRVHTGDTGAESFDSDDYSFRRGEEYLQAREDFFNKNTIIEQDGVDEERFMRSSYEYPTSGSESFHPEDIDPNIDGGEEEKNARFRRYRDNYDKSAKDPEVTRMHERSKKLFSDSVDQVKKTRKIFNKRDFYREKILQQTGRMKPINEFSQNCEPGYSPDYLPHFFTFSDASEWISEEEKEAAQRELQVEQLEHSFEKMPTKYGKLARYSSHYWSTNKHIEYSSSGGETGGGGGTLKDPDERAKRESIYDDGTDDVDDEEGDLLTGSSTDGASTDALSEGVVPERPGDESLDDDGNFKLDSGNSSSSFFAGSSSGKEQEAEHNAYKPDHTIHQDFLSTTEDCPTDEYGEHDIGVSGLNKLEHNSFGLSDFHQMLIRTGRHCKVTTGGRIFSTSALVLIGNGAGIGGLGYGRGETFADAMSAALKDAKKRLITIHMVDSSISYQSKQKYCRARVYVWPLGKKSGVRGAFKHQQIIDLFGLTDIRIKTHGRRNDHNIYKALLRCLQTSETPEMNARRRGKKVWDINKYWRVNNRSRAY